MLASDLNNPNFVNPTNPDDALQVEFYDFAAPDDWGTRENYEKGIPEKKFRKECPFVRISIPGNNLNVVERAADGRDINRFPKQWLFYQMQTGKIADGQNVPGWQIDEWAELDHTTKHKLKFLRFVTVEQLAGATDSQIQQIGMGAEGLRIRAREALKLRQRSEIDAAVKERDTRLVESESKMAAMQTQMTEMMELMQAQNQRLQQMQTIPGHLSDARDNDDHGEHPGTPTKRKAGRPPKVRAEVQA